jgi:hypothetical protein
MSRGKKLAKKIEKEIAEAEQAGTRKPAATQCACGTWRSPGLAHSTPQGVGCAIK